MFLILFFLSTLTFSSEQALETYCFPSAISAQRVLRGLKVILLPGDKHETAEACLSISMNHNRRELIQKYALSLEPKGQVTFSSESLRKDLCKIKVEKLQNKDLQSVDASVGKGLQANAQDSKGEAKILSQISTTGLFELTVNQDSIKGNCRYISPDKYEISLEVSKLYKPLPLAVAPGSTVIVTHPPPDQETSKLKTMVLLSRGERIEIGSVLKDLKDKVRGVDAGSGGQIASTQGHSSENVYLEID